MNIKELKFLWSSDLYRYSGNINLKEFIKNILITPGFKYSFFMRLSSYLNKKNPIYKFLFLCSQIILLHYGIKYGISIPFNTQIGKGLYIGHFGGIIVSSRAVIGDNCNISQNVTVGVANRGKNKGYPTIGNNIYIGPGAKIFGSIKIGDNAAIGANCVVTKDIPNNAVVVGVPGKVISYEGSKGYVNRTNYSTRVQD